MGITHCLKLISIKYFIIIQLIVFLPLVLIRDLAKLSSTALIADGFILVGLIYIFSSEISIVADRGIADIQLFNPKDFSLFVGYVVGVPPVGLPTLTSRFQCRGVFVRGRRDGHPDHRCDAGTAQVPQSPYGGHAGHLRRVA
jgi:hypothetical protein